MIERTVRLKTEEAYSQLKAALTAKCCKVICEQPPIQIRFNQGSLWGITPKTAKKNINVDFQPIDKGTRIRFSSSLASDWKNITLVGCFLAGVLVGLCIWIALDLTGFNATLKPSFWNWIVTSGGNIDLAAAQAFINLTWELSAFLSVIIFLEATIVVYVRSKIDAFSVEVLK